MYKVRGQGQPETNLATLQKPLAKAKSPTNRPFQGLTGATQISKPKKPLPTRGLFCLVLFQLAEEDVNGAEVLAYLVPDSVV